nr:UDP-N-acetylmuramoyl-L-alanyl-D-glutamate--2,6-diaminopimelate ligase [Clostridia bacterium]
MTIRELFGTGPDIQVASLATDSRLVEPGSVFFCVTGATVDGHRFASGAADRGAVCIVHSSPLDDRRDGTFYLRTDDVTAALNTAASAFYGHPSRRMTVFGVTGTNGKTTVATVLRELYSAVCPTGYIGTIANQYNHAPDNQPHTTPDCIRLHRILHDMLTDGLGAVAMEVSSHGLVQRRVDSIDFDVAIMTNLTHEHLDYHHTMEEYLEAKAMLFRMLKPDAVAVLNADDPSCAALAAATRARVVTYSLGTKADYEVRGLDLMPTGSRFRLLHAGTEHAVETNLSAAFNVSNLLAVLAAIHETGIPLERLIPLVRNLSQVEGRIERIDQGQPFHVIVDYAHTPDGFEKIFEYARAIRNGGRILAVFGSAGKRDTEKRPLLGEIADASCDRIILTEEDCRNEDPSRIAESIRSGITRAETSFIPDREAAIRQALKEAQSGDIVLILAKGNEKFMDREDRSD